MALSVANNSLVNKTETVFALEELSKLDNANFDTLKLLVLADQNYPAQVVRDYVQAIMQHSKHEVTIKSPRKSTSRWKRYLPRKKIPLEDEQGRPYDAVIIHYSICILFESYISLELIEELRSFKGVKIQIIQDEHRWVNRMIQQMDYLKIDAIVSSLSFQNIEKVYGSEKLKKVFKVSALPGYVPKRLENLKTRPIRDRINHLVYRGRELPFWMGKACFEKTNLTNQFITHSKGLGLSLDLSSKEKDRIYGEDWITFLSSAKAVLGLEGGASIFDFDGGAERVVKQYLRSNRNAKFEEVYDAVLHPFEGNVVHRTITPRSFEAISLRTVQVMFQGTYRGVLQPWRHYLPLEKDFSNIRQIAGILKDDKQLQKIADRTYDEIIGSRLYSDKILGLGLDALISKLIKRKKN